MVGRLACQFGVMEVTREDGGIEQQAQWIDCSWPAPEPDFYCLEFRSGQMIEQHAFSSIWLSRCDLIRGHGYHTDTKRWVQA